MTRSKVILALGCIGLSLAGCGGKAAKETPPPAPAPQAAVPMVEVTANTLNIREQASTTGAVVGTLVPVVLKAFRIDPAIASGVIITTFTDVFGFLSFLGLATLLMGFLL